MIIAQELHGVCAQQVHITIDYEGAISSVELLGGCDGQGKVLNALLTGMTPAEAIEKLRGIKCGNKDVSCASEVARVLDEAVNDR